MRSDFPCLTPAVKRDTLSARMRTLLTLLTLALLPQAAPTDWRNAPPADWQPIFNGRNLDGWVMKLAHHELGDNYADTFRVENGVIRVMYDKYTATSARASATCSTSRSSRTTCSRSSTGSSASRRRAARATHVEQRRDGPLAGARNDPQGSGLADLESKRSSSAGGRTTMNVCTPGTEIFMNGEMVKAHCTNSTSKIYPDDEWVTVEVEVLGAERVRHIIDGQTVLRVPEAHDWRGGRRPVRSGNQEDGTILRRATSACRPRASPSSSGTSGS